MNAQQPNGPTRRVALKRWLVAALVILAVPVGLVLGSALWFARGLPSADDLVSVQPWQRTVLYDVKGRPITAFYEEDRILVPLEEVPPHLVNAFIATEDRKFYRHWGLNIFAIGKALLEDVLARRWVRGASTITQQLARNLFLTQEQTVSRKIREAILAIRIERQYTKKEILAMYLNQIYFGEGAYGVEAAARRFYGKHVRDLSLAEASLLAGLPRNPRAYSPRRDIDKAKRRQAIVLAAMADMNMITEGEAEAARAEVVNVLKGDLEEPGAYFAEHIRQTLERKYGAQALYREGLKVYTTLDLDLQLAAEVALEENLKAMEQRLHYHPARSESKTARDGRADRTEYVQGSLIALDPHTGYVKAMVGGRDFDDSNWNRATQAPRQPGSAFKTFVYTAAVDNGFTPADILIDDPLIVCLPDGKEWRPQNFSAEFEGPMTVRYALAHSVNIPAIKVADKIGQETVISYARRMGIRSPIEPYMSIAIGTYEVTLLEIASAYGVLATSGIRAEPMTIVRIESRDGRVLEQNFPRKSEALSAQTAYVMISLLQSVVNEGTAASIRSHGMTHTLAGKTGTTDDYTDAWFIGFSPDIVAGVWVGFDWKKRMGSKETGSRAALPIWIDFMKAALEGVPDKAFAEPEGIVHRVVCKETGLLATDRCAETRSEVFIEGTEPWRPCDTHHGRLLSAAP